MANLSITPANVFAVPPFRTRPAIAGEAITAGQAIYLDDDRIAWLSTAAGTLQQATCDGIAMNSAAAGQPVDAMVEGLIYLGATLAAGTVYVVSSDPGMICPDEDIDHGKRVVLIGVGRATNGLYFKPWPSNVIREGEFLYTLSDGSVYQLSDGSFFGV